MNRFVQMVVLLVAVGILVAGASLFSSAANQTDPGSTANDKAGTLALYTWLDELGMPATRLTGSFDLNNIDTLFIVEPTKTFTTSEIGSVDTFLRHGGDVVVADDGGVSAPLLENFAATISPADLSGTAHNIGDIGLQADVHNVPVSGAGSVSGPQSTDLLTLDGQVVAAQFAVGSGYLDVISSELPVSNDGLRRQDSANFVLALMENSRGPRIGFDEVHHGASSAGAAFLGQGLGDVFSGPLGLATLLGLALALFALSINGIRLGKPLASRDPAKVPSAVDRIADLSERFERTGDRGSIVTRYVDELKQRVAELTGVRSTVDDDEFLASLMSGPVDETRSVLVEGRLMERSRPSSGAVMKYAQRVVTLEKTWSDANRR